MKGRFSIHNLFLHSSLNTKEYQEGKALYKKRGNYSDDVYLILYDLDKKMLLDWNYQYICGFVDALFETAHISHEEKKEIRRYYFLCDEYFTTHYEESLKATEEIRDEIIQTFTNQ